MPSCRAGSVRRISQFTADASHELRAPVALIRATAEVTLQNERTNAEYKQAVQEILDESERTSQVVESLMLLSRADSGNETLELSASDMCAIVRSAAEQGEKLARAHRLTFSVNVPERPIGVNADADALRRALLILLDNAVKYTAPAGSVQVRLETVGNTAVTKVVDTGIGIAADDLPHVFDRFWRADKARSREQGGAGLGLSIAKWIVDMHGGSIHAISELGKGSTLAVKIPTTEETESGLR